MLNRIVPFFAILCIIIVSITSFFLWRAAEREPRSESSVRALQLQKAGLGYEHVERAEEYARRAEAAALKAETLLETLLLVEARLLAKEVAAQAEAAGQGGTADAQRPDSVPQQQGQTVTQEGAGDAQPPAENNGTPTGAQTAPAANALGQ